MTVDVQQREYTVSDGMRLQFREWKPAVSRGCVIALHGIQSHSGWYGATCHQLSSAGWQVVFPDRRGSGLNGCQRGHAIHGLRLIHDVRALARQVRHEAARAEEDCGPLVLLGLSWGGKVAAAAVSLFPSEFSGLALLYPGLVPRIRPQWWQSLALRCARRWDVVRTDIPIPLRDVSLFTASPEGQRFIENDPLALHAVTSGLLSSGRDLDRIISERIRGVGIPVLLMLAGRDRIIDNARTRELVRRCSSRFLTEVSYPDACHTLEFEPDREAIHADLLHWLSAVEKIHQRQQVAATEPCASGTGNATDSSGVLRLSIPEPGRRAQQSVLKRDRRAE